MFIVTRAINCATTHIFALLSIDRAEIQWYHLITLQVSVQSVPPFILLTINYPHHVSFLDLPHLGAND